jgi:hypothetical protein
MITYLHVKKKAKTILGEISAKFTYAYGVESVFFK